MLTWALLVVGQAAGASTAPVSIDTLRIVEATRPPAFDGVADDSEYGTPSLVIRTGQGTVAVWARRWRGEIYLAAALPDSTWYWGDDFVLSLDPRGDRGSTPGPDDIQWYVRRAADSSVIHRGAQGRWTPPRGDPDWRLGRSREGEGWALRTADGPRGWSLELRLGAGWLAGGGGAPPAMAVRVYDDAPHGWFVWPAVPGLPAPTALERRPDRWAVVRLVR
ncbi:MAG TPA: hypothetical protein VNK43_07135 [Gemmatimonadales bacterium]|nr:hypothetical protein [Gemmatimonadales bacterium]